MFLRQSTNAQDVIIGPFLDDGDGKTVEPTLSIGVSDIRLGKNGGNIVAKNSGGATYDELGFYQITLNATDTSTVGELLIAVHMTGALPVFKYCYVLEEAIYDAMFAASASAFDSNARVDVASIEGSDASDQINAACDAAIETYGLDHLVSASVAGSDVTDNSIIARLVSKESTADWDDFVNTTDSLQALRDRGDSAWTTGGGGGGASAADIADAVWDEAASGHASAGSFGKYVADILTDTAEIGSAGAGLTAVPWNSSWDAEVQSECTDALNAYDPPTKAEMDAMWTTAQTESYASDGAAATPAQLLYMIYCAVGEFAISSTTITGKKLDGSTTAMTWTINDASNPTSRTRAS